MIAGINTETTRDAWLTVPGRTVKQTVNANGDPLTITFLFNNTPVFIQEFTYDADNVCTQIDCVAPVTP